MNDWMHRKITDYWDSATREPESAADRLDQLDDSGRARALTEIADAVTEHLRVLPDDVMLQAAVPVIDDLYKGACYAGRWDSSLEAYLEASASTFFSGLADRGLMVQYAVDNAWEDLTRPLQLFPSWFTACGFVYVCPQALAQQLEQAGPSGTGGSVDAESRHVASELMVRCQEAQRHFVHLDADCAEDSFEPVFALREAPGVLTIFRNDAPEPGSKISVWYPGGSSGG